jgi:hypothetical protein
MTRDQAIGKIKATGLDIVDADRIVTALLALDLLKREEPAPDVKGAIDALSNTVLRASRFSPAETGWMIGPHGAETIIARLNGAGYRVSRKFDDEPKAPSSNAILVPLVSQQLVGDSFGRFSGAVTEQELIRAVRSLGWEVYRTGQRQAVSGKNFEGNQS